MCTSRMFSCLWGSLCGSGILVLKSQERRAQVTQEERLLLIYTGTPVTTYVYIYIYTYRVSQEECARLRQSVPYIKIYRYNPKHLCLKLNGYGDNGKRKVWSSCGPTHWTSHLTAFYLFDLDCSVNSVSVVSVAPAVHSAILSQWVTYTAWNSKDSYDAASEIFVVRFTGVTSLTS
jgi:hypothetical protein